MSLIMTSSGMPCGITPLIQYVSGVAGCNVTGIKNFKTTSRILYICNAATITYINTFKRPALVSLNPNNGFETYDLAVWPITGNMYWMTIT